MVSPPLFETAKTEHKAEMEVPATTKVKVTDFFQRLVCGLLIFFHSPRGLHSSSGRFIHQVTPNGSDSNSRCWRCYQFHQLPRAYFFCHFWIKLTTGGIGFSVGSPLGLQSFLDFHPKLKQELTLTLDKMLWLKGPLIYFPQSSAYLFLNRTLVTKP